MDLFKLFRACRTGDINLVRDLVNKKDIDLNSRDLWDSSPLYYASLCGHTELVRFLLANGAKCDASTYEGERCVYGALTNEIRNILVREYQVISRTLVQRREYDEFLRKALESGRLADVTFIIDNEKFPAHKCILAARCQYFEEMFHFGRWKDKQFIKFSQRSVNQKAFLAILHFLYTGILEFNKQLKRDIIKLLHKCKLNAVIEMVHNFDRQLTGKAKNKLKQIMIECPVSGDFHRLYAGSLPDGMTPQEASEKPLHQLDSSISSRHLFCDVIFKVNGSSIFYCHKVFFSMQSEFFRALFEDYFDSQKETVDNKSVIELGDISVEEFEALVCFMYTSTTALSLECALKLLMNADVYLINSLKKFCANVVGEHIDQLNAIDVIKLARTLNLPKLEKTATEHIANNLQQYIYNEEFHRLVVSDAQEVKERQETDTIDIIDDLRYYLNSSSKFSVRHDMEIEANLKAIDDLLAMLGLEA